MNRIAEQYLEQYPFLSSALKRAKLALSPRIPHNEATRTLQRLAAESREFLASAAPPRLRVLWSPSFNINHYFWVHDGLLSLALRLRGVEVIPVMCGGAQVMECNVFSGSWAGYDRPGRKHTRRLHCDTCRRCDTVAWKNIWGLPLEDVRQHVRKSDVEMCRAKVDATSFDKCLTFTWKGLPLGRLAADGVVNGNLVGDLEAVPDREEAVRVGLLNGMLLHLAYERLLQRYHPDRVITHDGTYLMWAVWNAEAARLAIPYYSYYMGDRPGTWVYVRNGTALSHNLTEAWTTWRSRSLEEEEEETLDQFLGRRLTGSTSVLNPMYATGQSSDESHVISRLNDRPTALLAANVVWDAASLQASSPMFGTLFRWAVETVRFFIAHPQFRLIIKPHPVETSPKIPRTRALLSDAITAACGTLPSNIVLLKPDTDVSPYDLMSRCQLGLVFTSTVGLEMATRGVPVIAGANAHYTRKGFTIDVDSETEYFDAILRQLSSNEDSAATATRRELARRYFYLYSFRYQIDTGLHRWTWGQQPSLLVSSVAELLPGANRLLDHVCDSIIEGESVVSGDRLPPSVRKCGR